MHPREDRVGGKPMTYVRRYWDDMQAVTEAL